jgi:hypothetical protein
MGMREAGGQRTAEKSHVFELLGLFSWCLAKRELVALLELDNLLELLLGHCQQLQTLALVRKQRRALYSAVPHLWLDAGRRLDQFAHGVVELFERVREVGIVVADLRHGDSLSLSL